MATAKPKHVLVTGATGFIGRHLVRRLIADGNTVSCLVRIGSATGELEAAGATLLPGDVAAPASVGEAITASKATAVFHLAGLVRARKAEDFLRVNTAGTGSVAAACAAPDSPPTLVIVSSLAAAGPATGGRSKIESDAPAPASNYGRSKLAGELAAMKYADKVPLTIVRPGIVFGEGDEGVLQMMKPIASRGVHAVPGDGGQKLSLVHVADLVELLLLASEQGERVRVGGPAGQGVYFASAEPAVTHRELGRLMAEAVERRDVKLLRVPAFLTRLAGFCGDLAGRFTGQPLWLNSDKMAEALAGSWECDSAKARLQLGWREEQPLEQRMRQTALWYRRHRWL
jgi:dihydroflavonol-4-reductase